LPDLPDPFGGALGTPVVAGGCRERRAKGRIRSEEDSMQRPHGAPTLAATILCLFLAGPAVAQDQPLGPQQKVLTGQDALGDWHRDAPGVRRLITLADLLPPMPNPDARNFPEKASAAGPNARPQVPAGFQIEMVASGIKNPRAMRVAPNGDLFVANSMANEVLVFRMRDGSARPARQEVFATGLYKPYGIAFYPPGPNPQWVYIANADSVVRFPYKNGDLKASGRPQPIVEHIPALHHWTRDIAFSPDGKTLYLAVGSGSNIALDMAKEPFTEGGLEGWIKTKPLGATWDTEEKRANVLAFDPNGKNERIFATGLRNCSGLTVQPGTGNLWCVVNERDELGDDVPFEYATHVVEGKFYGWPWYYLGDNEDPRRRGQRPDLAGQVTVPDVLFQAHSAPLGIAFYEGNNFPADYKGDAFVTFHGSWNRGIRTGYKVVRVPFENGKPTGEYEDFITGFVLNDKEVWGRPVGIAVGKDGSMFFSEDGNGTIWRVSHVVAIGSR
jgi:glucose/arabinose dehydrogenase